MVSTWAVAARCCEPGFVGWPRYQADATEMRHLLSRLHGVIRHPLAGEAGSSRRHNPTKGVGSDVGSGPITTNLRSLGAAAGATTPQPDITVAGVRRGRGVMPPPTRDQVTPTLVEALVGLTADAGSIPAASINERSITMSGTRGAGNYYESTPLDFELLRRMPDEGSALGYHVLGLTVKHATRELNKEAPPGGEIPVSAVTARIRSMHVEGHCTKVKVLAHNGGTHGWQRTAKGKKFLEEHTKKTGLSLVKKEAQA